VFRDEEVMLGQYGDTPGIDKRIGLISPGA
jgi:hypothetical protein